MLLPTEKEQKLKPQLIQKTTIAPLAGLNNNHMATDKNNSTLLPTFVAGVVQPHHPQQLLPKQQTTTTTDILAGTYSFGTTSTPTLQHKVYPPASSTQQQQQLQPQQAIHSTSTSTTTSTTTTHQQTQQYQQQQQQQAAATAAMLVSQKQQQQQQLLQHHAHHEHHHYIPPPSPSSPPFKKRLRRLDGSSPIVSKMTASSLSVHKLNHSNISIPSLSKSRNSSYADTQMSATVTAKLEPLSSHHHLTKSHHMSTLSIPNPSATSTCASPSIATSSSSAPLLLNNIPYNAWENRRVRIMAGPYTGLIATVLKFENGWVMLRLPPSSAMDDTNKSSNKSSSNDDHDCEIGKQEQDVLSVHNSEKCGEKDENGTIMHNRRAYELEVMDMDATAIHVKQQQQLEKTPLHKVIDGTVPALANTAVSCAEMSSSSVMHHLSNNNSMAEEKYQPQPPFDATISNAIAMSTKPIVPTSIEKEVAATVMTLMEKKTKVQSVTVPITNHLTTNDSNHTNIQQLQSSQAAAAMLVLSTPDVTAKSVTTTASLQNEQQQRKIPLIDTQQLRQSACLIHATTNMNTAKQHETATAAAELGSAISTMLAMSKGSGGSGGSSSTSSLNNSMVPKATTITTGAIIPSSTSSTQKYTDKRSNIDKNNISANEVQQEQALHLPPSLNQQQVAKQTSDAVSTLNHLNKLRMTQQRHHQQQQQTAAAVQQLKTNVNCNSHHKRHGSIASSTPTTTTRDVSHRKRGPDGKFLPISSNTTLSATAKTVPTGVKSLDQTMSSKKAATAIDSMITSSSTFVNNKKLAFSGNNIATESNVQLPMIAQEAQQQLIPPLSSAPAPSPQSIPRELMACYRDLASCATGRAAMNVVQSDATATAINLNNSHNTLYGADAGVTGANQSDLDDTSIASNRSINSRASNQHNNSIATSTTISHHRLSRRRMIKKVERYEDTAMLEDRIRSNLASSLALAVEASTSSFSEGLSDGAATEQQQEEVGGTNNASTTIRHHTYHHAVVAPQIGGKRQVKDLCTRDALAWTGRKVRILAGVLKTQVGSVLRINNGWVHVRVQIGIGKGADTCRRANELEVLPIDYKEDQMQQNSNHNSSDHVSVQSSSSSSDVALQQVTTATAASCNTTTTTTTTPSPQLCTRDASAWTGRKVRVLAGILKNQVGAVLRINNGWVHVRVHDGKCGETCRRATELEVLPIDYNEEEHSQKQQMFLTKQNTSGDLAISLVPSTSASCSTSGEVALSATEQQLQSSTNIPFLIPHQQQQQQQQNEGEELSVMTSMDDDDDHSVINGIGAADAKNNKGCTIQGSSNNPQQSNDYYSSDADHHRFRRPYDGLNSKSLANAVLSALSTTSRNETSSALASTLAALPPTTPAPVIFTDGQQSINFDDRKIMIGPNYQVSSKSIPIPTDTRGRKPSPFLENSSNKTNATTTTIPLPFKTNCDTSIAATATHASSSNASTNLSSSRSPKCLWKSEYCENMLALKSQDIDLFLQEFPVGEHDLVMEMLMDGAAKIKENQQRFKLQQKEQLRNINPKYCNDKIKNDDSVCSKNGTSRFCSADVMKEENRVGEEGCINNSPFEYAWCRILEHRWGGVGKLISTSPSVKINNNEDIKGNNESKHNCFDTAMLPLSPPPDPQLTPSSTIKKDGRRKSLLDGTIYPHKTKRAREAANYYGSLSVHGLMKHVHNGSTPNWWKPPTKNNLGHNGIFKKDEEAHQM